MVIALNYAFLGIPLIRKSASINDNYRAVLIKQAKSGNMFKASGDEYMLEVFRKEKASIDRKMLILNCGGVALLVILASWVIFGLVFHRK